MKQVQANVLQLAGDFFLEKRRADSEHGHSLKEYAEDRGMCKGNKTGPGLPTRTVTPYPGLVTRGWASCVEPRARQQVRAGKEDTGTGREFLALL